MPFKLLPLEALPLFGKLDHIISSKAFKHSACICRRGESNLQGLRNWLNIAIIARNINNKVRSSRSLRLFKHCRQHATSFGGYKLYMSTVTQ